MGQIFQKGLDNPVSPEFPTKPLFKEKRNEQSTQRDFRMGATNKRWVPLAFYSLWCLPGSCGGRTSGGTRPGSPGGTRKGLFGPECEGGTQSTKSWWDFRRSVEVLRTLAAHFSDGGTSYFPTMATTACPTPHALRNGTWTPKAL